MKVPTKANTQPVPSLNSALVDIKTGLIKPPWNMFFQLLINNGGIMNGVPAGGNIGQILAKLSAADYDTGWSDASGGSAGVPGLKAVLKGTATLDYPLINANSFQGLTMAVQGAAFLDWVYASPLGGFDPRCNFISYVSDPNTVTIYAQNLTANPINLGPQTFTAVVLKFS